MFRPRKPKTEPSKPKKAAVKVKRPSGRFSARILDEINREFKPDYVPDYATVLVSWLRLPGENTQRTQNPFVANRWKKQIQDDFAYCLYLQSYHGVMENPRMHSLVLGSKGDENNRISRIKYLIDKLQIRRDIVDKNGKVRVYGLLSLIEDDKVFTPENRICEERSCKTEDSKVILWVWDEQRGY